MPATFGGEHWSVVVYLPVASASAGLVDSSISTPPTKRANLKPKKPSAAVAAVAAIVVECVAAVFSTECAAATRAVAGLWGH